MKKVITLFNCLLLLISVRSFCQEATIVLNKAKYFYNTSKEDSAFFLLNQIINKRADDKVICEAYNLLGHIHLDKGNLPAALENYLFSEKIGNKNNDAALITQADINISGIYREQNNLIKAREYIDKAEKQIDKLNNAELKASCYNNKAILLEMNNKFDSAIVGYNKALGIYTELKDSNRIAVSYNNLGVVYKNKGDYIKALDYYSKAIAIEQAIDNSYVLAAGYINIGSIYERLKKYDEAIANNKIGLEIANAIPAQYLIVSALENIAMNYEDKQAYDSAYFWEKKLFGENEKYLNNENNKQINELQIKYETEKKDLRINVLSKADSINSLLIQNQELKISQQLLDLSNNQLEISRDSADIALKNQRLIKNKLDSSFQDAEIKELSRQKFIQLLELQNRKLEIQQKDIVIASGIMAAILIALFIYGRIKAKSKQKELVFKQQLYEEKIQAEAKIAAAEEKERQRISRDLHDNMGAYTTALISNIQQLKQQNILENLTEKMEDNAQQILSSLRETI